MAGSDQQKQQDVSGNTGQRASHRCGRRWGVKHSGLWMMLLLALASLLFMAGCGGDDDGDTERVDLTDVRISDTPSVFDILENRTFEFTTDGVGGTDGVFRGVANGSISFRQVTVGADGIPRAPFVMRDADNVDPATGNAAEGEGDSDGGASCNFNFRSSTIPTIVPGTLVKCGLCDTLVTATGVPLGGTGPGELVWHLNGARDPLNTPAFVSLAIDVEVGVDENGDLVTVNGVPVQAEPVQPVP